MSSSIIAQLARSQLRSPIHQTARILLRCNRQLSTTPTFFSLPEKRNVPSSTSATPLPPHRRHAAPQAYMTDLQRAVAEYTTPSTAPTKTSSSATSATSATHIYTAPDHRLFYTFSYAGSSLFLMMAAVYATNTSVLPHTTLLVRVTAALVVTGSSFLAWFWTGVARRLVRSVELLPLGAVSSSPSSTTSQAQNVAAPHVRITLRRPFLFFPVRQFTLPVDEVRISHRFGSAYAPPSLRYQSPGDVVPDPHKADGPIGRFFSTCIEDHKLITQPQSTPKIYIRGKYYYLDPRGEFLDDGRAVDRVFKLES